MGQIFEKQSSWLALSASNIHTVPDMKILVTGSSGTIGTRLCEVLMEKGHDVTGVDRKPNQWQEKVNDITVVADLCEKANVSRLPTNIDLVIHLAANARVYELVEHPERAEENMSSTFNVLEYARGNKIPRFIFASSREVYGNIHADLYSEDMARIEECESPYTASKIAGEALVESYRRCYGLKTVMFRFSNVYGAYDDSERVVPLFIRQARANETMTIFGETKKLDFTYIDDTVQGIVQTIDKFDAAEGEVLNLAFGQGTTILHLAETVKELLGSSSEIKIGESRTGEITHYIADISKAKKLIGYDPKSSFEDGIRKAVEWYKQNT